MFLISFFTEKYTLVTLIVTTLIAFSDDRYRLMTELAAL